jgi:hypothetical protein
MTSNIGPQRGPSTPHQIEAETKLVTRQFRELAERLMNYDTCHDGDVDEAAKAIVFLCDKLDGAE